MDLLQECATNYTKLLTSRYHIICGRSKAGQKERLAFDITFWQSDFYHLAGLHKLTDVSQFQDKRREDVLKKILAGAYSDADAHQSRYFSKIESRIRLVSDLESFLDTNNLIFHYDPQKNKGSLIQADYLLQNQWHSRQAYLFLVKRFPDSNECACESMFLRTGRDYTKGQQKFALLYKEKTNLTTGTTIVQYDKL